MNGLRPLVVDLHCHLLPSLDDGPRDWEEAVRLAAEAWASGTQVLVCTPHDMAGAYANPPERVTAQLRELRRRLEAAGVPLALRAGNEVYLEDESLDRLRAGQLNFLGSEPGAPGGDPGASRRGHHRYLLVELPVGQWPLNAEELLYELRVAGVTPVLAHVERYEELRAAPERLGRLVEAGCRAQVNAGTFAGREGTRLQRQAMEWLRAGWVHFLGSDAHGGGRRTSAMAEGRSWIARQRGGARLLEQIDRNAAALLAGQAVPAPA
ncbi:MAG: protein-tyrosine-phosphatase [Bacillota bacterium]|nr:protein-tyrosine-phosphatase [Bacillota bacterium]